MSDELELEEAAKALINEQASEITEIVYPEWAGKEAWRVTHKHPEQEDGYDMYVLQRSEGELMIVPANRLVLLKHFTERFSEGERP